MLASDQVQEDVVEETVRELKEILKALAKYWRQDIIFGSHPRL